MSNDTHRADQIAFHFYTKLFYIVNQARATEDSPSNQKVDKWFNLETPDSELFTKEEREPYRAVSLAPFPGPPTLEIDVLLSIPELTNNQVLVYMPPDSSASRVRIEPTPKFILLETWSLGMTFHRPGSASDQHRDTSPDVALPIIYKHGIILFRSVYSLLRVLPAWKFYKRLKRKISGFNRKGNLGIKLRVRNPGESQTDTSHILGFNARLSPTYRTPLPTSRHDFQAIPHLLGSFTLSTTYLTTPNFQLDELESILSSKFLSLDLEGFVPTLDKNRQRDSLTGSSLPNSSGIRSGMLSRSPPRAIGRVSSSGNGGHGHGVDNFNIADRFILPSRIPGLGAPSSLGMTASSGTSALIPPPRPFPTMNPISNPPMSPLLTTLPSPIAGSSAVNRLRKESLNSISSSSSISTRDTPGPQGPFNAGTASSLSTSPVTGTGALPIRRPTINPVHPFKSSTFSSTSGSSPSLSIRQGVTGAGGVHGGAASPVGVPSSLSGNTGAGAPGGTRPVSPHSTHSRQPSSASPIGTGRFPPASPSPIGSHPSHFPATPAENAFPSPSSLGDRDRRPGTSGSGGSSEGRRVSIGSGVGVPSGPSDEDSRVPGSVNMPPPRKRYSSSFGHRYGGGGSGGSATGMGVQVGSANSGGGVGGGNEGRSPASGGVGTPGSGHASGRNTPASPRFGPGQEGRKEINPSFLGEGATDDDEISIFVQDIDSRKPLSGRAKEKETRDRDRERRERSNTLDDDWRYDQRARGHEPQPQYGDGGQVKGKGKEREEPWDDWHQPLSDQARYMKPNLRTTSPPARDSIPTVQRQLEQTSEQTAAQTSISPTRGPMLTSQNEVEERLKKMNEAFFKSLEGLSSGGSVRRKDRQKEKDKDSSTDKNDKEGLTSPGAGATTSPSTPGSGPGSDSREKGGTGLTSNASCAPQAQGPGLGAVGFPSSASPYLYHSPFSSGGMAPQAGLGLGIGHAREHERGSYSSTSSSTLATSEIGMSQGSEEVIGRLELYDEPSLRRFQRRG